MLVVSIPKSGSTSVADTVAGYLGKKKDASSVVPAGKSWAFPNLGRIHPSAGDYDATFLDYLKEDSVFHYHVPPTDTNLALLSSTRKVIVLRDPEEIPGAYFREIKCGYRAPLEYFSGCRSELEFLKRAQVGGLLDELQRFYIGWKSTALSDRSLILDYKDDIRQDFEKTIIRIIHFFENPLPGSKIKIKKSRYTKGWYAQIRKLISNPFL